MSRSFAGNQVIIGESCKMIKKCAITFHSCISVTDKVKINDQDKSIGTGSL